MRPRLVAASRVPPARRPTGCRWASAPTGTGAGRGWDELHRLPRRPRGARRPGAPRLHHEAGPLAVIRATGPFLHDGSVPAPDALLRPARFRVGGRVPDAARVGFVSEGPDAGAFGFDTALPGDGGHEGHDDGTAREDRQRRDLPEYLRSP